MGSTTMNDFFGLTKAKTTKHSLNSGMSRSVYLGKPHRTARSFPSHTQDCILLDERRFTLRLYLAARPKFLT